MPDAFTILIPARLGSTRFPAKVLAAETGKPLIVHVCEAAARAGPRVVVATDDPRIAGPVRDAGFEAVLTAADHPNGTSRLVEAAALLGLAGDHVVVNVQGDEPEIEPGVILGAVEALRAIPTAQCGTVVSPFGPHEDPTSPSVVKAALGPLDPAARAARAVYFSRAPIPYPRDNPAGGAYFKHVGLYAYRVADLNRYAALPPTPLEKTEALEQLRWLEHGCTIAAAVRQAAHHGVDTPADYAAFVARMSGKSA